MSSTNGSGRALLGMLRAPLRAPEWVAEGLESLVGATRDLAAIRSELTRVRKQTEPLDELLPTLRDIEKGLTTRLDDLYGVVAALDGKAADLNDAILEVGSDLAGRLDSLHRVVAALEGEESHVNQALRQVGSELATQLGTLHEVVAALESEDSYLNQAILELGRDVGGRLDSLHEVISSLEGDESHLNRAVGGLDRHLGAMHETITELRNDVEQVTNRLPDPSRGPLEKVRDALTSGNEDSTG